MVAFHNIFHFREYDKRSKKKKRGINNLESGYKIRSQLMMKMVKIMNDKREIIQKQAITFINSIILSE